MGAAVKPSVKIARAVRMACSAAVSGSIFPNLPLTISSAILKAISSLCILVLNSRMLTATSFGPTRPSTKSAMSLAITHSVFNEGSSPIDLAQSLMPYNCVSSFSMVST